MREFSCDRNESSALQLTHRMSRPVQKFPTATDTGETGSLVPDQEHVEPRLLKVGTLQELLKWYETNLCGAQLIDPRGYRVRFNLDDFIHLIQLKNKYGKEPKNRRLAIEEIKRGGMKCETRRFDQQRAMELAWARQISTQPDCICSNWQVLGSGNEMYIKDFGGAAHLPKYRVLVCKVRGTTRQVVTLFPRERIGEKELRGQVWP